MLTNFLQSALFVLSAVGINTWTSSSLREYNLQLTGALILLYFLIRLIRSISHSPLLQGSLNLEIVLAFALSFLLILSTGGLTSPLFFIFYLLLFSVTLYTSTTSAIVATITIAILLFTNNSTLSDTQLISLFSLLTVSPLTIFLTSSYRQHLNTNQSVSKPTDNRFKSLGDLTMWLDSSLHPTLDTSINHLSNISLSLDKKHPEKPKLLSVIRSLTSLSESAASLKKSLFHSTEDTSANSPHNIDESLSTKN